MSNFKNYKNTVLDKKRQIIFSKLKVFKKLGLLAGGTALAMQLGHRKSLDFDFFCFKPISSKLAYKLKQVFGPIKVLINNSDELTILTKNGVKITFLYYPFIFRHKPILIDGLKVLTVIDIAAAKAYAMNRRANFRDYVDIYFVLKSKITLRDIIKNAQSIYGDLFSEKLFLAQLLYTEDIRKEEIREVIWIKKSVDINELKRFFKKRIKEIF